MSGKDRHRRKALCLQDVWRDILECRVKVHTGEKPAGYAMIPLSIGQTRNVMRNVHRRKTIWMWDVQRDLCKSVLPEMSCEDKHRIKPSSCMMCEETFWNVTRRYTQEKSHLLYWSLLAPNCGKKISCSNMLKPNHQMKYLSTTWTETLDIVLRFKELGLPSCIQLFF